MMSDEEKKSQLHIDSGWKEEAAREKQRLAEQEKAASSSAAESSPAGPPTLVDLVNVLAMQAVVSMGGMQGPGGERVPPNPALAKHHIDLLDVLEQKTRGNISEEEKKMLDAVLYELRMRYVQMVSGPAGVPTTATSTDSGAPPPTPAT